jgi:hypothetical protein
LTAGELGAPGDVGANFDICEDCDMFLKIIATSKELIKER